MERTKIAKLFHGQLLKNNQNILFLHSCAFWVNLIHLSILIQSKYQLKCGLIFKIQTAICVKGFSINFVVA